MMRQLHPSFLFRVKFMIATAPLQKLGLDIPLNPDANDSVDVHFKSVSGLEVSLQTETISEGGQNLYDYKVPLRTECSNLILKRGYVKNSTVVKWCKFNFNNPLGIVYPIPLFVELMDTEQKATVSWNITGAYPVKWSFDEMNAEESGILIESLELNCNSITLKDI